MPPLFSVIIPTWNNPQFLTPCVRSILMTGALNGLGELIIVNNGKQPIKRELGHLPNIKVLEPGENLGWERGLALGLQHSTAPFVCFQNDDTHIPAANWDFYQHLLYPFSDSNVAAVGPSTTVAAGWHSIYRPDAVMRRQEVSFLIFFTVMIRREHLDLVGGVDTTCPGGDDFDLSIRLRKAGKKLLINPRSFIIHHGFKTGERVHGGPTSPGGWNSLEMSDRTNQWLIQKHGFRTFFETRRGLPAPAPTEAIDNEGRIVRQFVHGEKVLELGCGFRKTVPHAVGMDLVPTGEVIPHVPGGGSVADVIGDVSEPLPFADLSQDTVIARHILEHCLDTVETLRNWARVVKVGGRLVIAVPNQDHCASIPLNPEHVHAFTPSSLKNLMELCGFKQISWQDPENGISFVGCYEKTMHMAPLPNGKALEAAHA